MRVNDYPVIIRQQPDGVYTWSCSIEAEYHRDSIRPGFYACIGIAVFLLLFGAFFTDPYDDWKSFLIVATCVVVFLVITFLVFGLAFSATDPRESYQMTETYVKTGAGRSSAYFQFKKARTVIVSRKYMELQGKMKRMRVYIPEEDIPFVRRYIKSRLPVECEIRHV